MSAYTLNGAAPSKWKNLSRKAFPPFRAPFPELRESIDLNFDPHPRPSGHGHLAKALIAQGKLSEVRLLLENELKNFEIQDSPNPNNTWVYQQELISWHLGQGDPFRANQYLQDTLDIARRRFDTSTQTDAWHYYQLVDYLVRSGKPEEAEAFARECLAALKSHRPNSMIQTSLGQALLDQQKFAEAEKFLFGMPKYGLDWASPESQA